MYWCNECISTHAPHARRGHDVLTRVISDLISTHAPHARRGRDGQEIKMQQVHFYSRASCEARPLKPTVRGSHANFYSRASCEARQIFRTLKTTV